MGRKIHLVAAAATIAWIGLIPAPVVADGRGSTSAAFLKLPTGARAIGMGESYVAVGDDVQTIAWNPAGLARMKRREFTFMHAEWFQGIRYESIAYAQPIGGFIYVGGGIDFMFGGKIDKTAFRTLSNPDSSAIDFKGVFEVSNTVVTAAGAIDASGLRWLPIPNVQLGMNARILIQKIDQATAASPIVDMGANWSPVRVPNLTVGIVGQNMGPPVKQQLPGGKTESKWPPITFQLGGAYKLSNRNLTTAIDILVPTDTPPKFSVGAEYWYRNIVCFRSGYKFQKQFDFNQYGSSGLEGLCLGVGFKYQIVQVDYAFATLGMLGATHRVSLTVNF